MMFRYPWIIYLLMAPFSSLAQEEKPDSCIVFFNFNETTLDKLQQKNLDYFLGRYTYAAGDSVYITIKGFTDKSGSIEYNEKLSLLRAKNVNESVKNTSTLYKFTCSVMGYGEKFALEESDSLERKVVITLWKLSAAKAQQPATALEVDTIIPLRNFSFVEDQPFLTPAAQASIPEYIASIKSLKYEKLEVIGYYNFDGHPLAETDPRFRLSSKRAEVVKKLLIDGGIDSLRVSSKGAGNSQMVIKNPVSIDDMRKNIRVELVVYRSK